MFKQHLVSGLSPSRPKACGVPGLFVGTGDSRLGEDSGLCLLAGHLSFSWSFALAPGQVPSSF